MFAFALAAAGAVYAQELTASPDNDGRTGPALDTTPRPALDTTPSRDTPPRPFTLSSTTPTTPTPGWHFTTETTQPCATCAPVTNGNAPWHYSARVGYATRSGFALTAGMIGSRGNALPMFMTTAIGGDTPLVPGTSAFANLAQRQIQWDWNITGRAPLYRTDRIGFGLVSDLFKPVNEPRPLGGPPAPSSKGTRIGIAVDY